jgi:hypothetical protein
VIAGGSRSCVAAPAAVSEDVRELRHSRIEDGVLRFGNPAERPATTVPMSSADPTGPTES